MDYFTDLVRILFQKDNKNIQFDIPEGYYLFATITWGDLHLESQGRPTLLHAGQFLLAAEKHGVTAASVSPETSSFSLLISRDLLLSLPGETDSAGILRQLFHSVDTLPSPVYGSFSDQGLETLLHYKALMVQEQENAAEASSPILRHLAASLLLFTARHCLPAHVHPPKGSKISTHQKMVNNTIELIHQHYTEDLSLASLASAQFTSPSYLCRIFKETSGITITTYLNQVRIANVKRMLIDTDNLIVDIASECGYNYIPYFNQLFKKMTGVTPTEYRKKNRVK